MTPSKSFTYVLGTLLLVFLFAPAPSSGQANITVLNTLSSCAAFSVDVMVSSCPDMTGFSIKFQFDNTKLSFVDVTNYQDNNILTDNGYQAFGFLVQQSANSYTVEVTRWGSSFWTYTSGRLFTINFAPLQVGTSTVSLPTHVLSNGMTILPSTATSGTVEIGVGVSPKIFLHGPYSGGTMSTALNTANLIPHAQPYNLAPWSYGGMEAVLNIPVDAVDWILCELRSTYNGTAVARRAGFILNNGSIVDTNGTCAISFPGIGAGSYYLVIKHRNHLAVMSASAIALGATAVSYDFTTALSQAYGTTPMIGLNAGGAPFGMWAGDVSANGQVKYNGASNDRVLILNRVGNIQTNTVIGYFVEDVNLNSQVKYNGASNDRVIILNSVGNIQTATKSTEVP
jgi:hypothetical protein